MIERVERKLAGNVSLKINLALSCICADMLKVHLKSNVSQLKVIFFYIYGLGKNKRI
jgi:hypothetical protein